MNIEQLKKQALDALLPNTFNTIVLDQVGKNVLEVIDYEQRIGRYVGLKTYDEFPAGFPVSKRMPGNQHVGLFDPLEILAWVRDVEDELNKEADEAYHAKWVEIERQRAIQREQDDAREAELLASETAEQTRQRYQSMERLHAKSMKERF